VLEYLKKNPDASGKEMQEARYLGFNNSNGIFCYHLGIIQLIIACVVVVWVFAMMSIFVNKNVFNVK
jgi:hypothetical protein